MRSRDKASDPAGTVGIQPEDELREAYQDWHEQCDRVWSAYSRWSGASGEDASLAFGAYTSALDREQSAAARCCALVRRRAAPIERRPSLR